MEFVSEVNRNTKSITKTITRDNCPIKLDLFVYDKPELADIYLKWQTFYDALGKKSNYDPDIMRNYQFLKMIYCLLTGHKLINKINGFSRQSDIYDERKDKIYKLIIVKTSSKLIQLQTNVKYDSIKLFDCIDMKKYRILEISNTSSFIDFCPDMTLNELVSAFKIPTQISGNIYNLKNNLYKPSLSETIDIETCLMKMEKYIQLQWQLEHKINKTHKLILSKSINHN